MRKYFFILSFLGVLTANAQLKDVNLEWKAEVHYFFDNTEYARSSYTIPQTMAGVNLLPQIGVSKDSTHFLFGGVNLLKKSGSDQYVDKATFVAYYQYKSKNSTLYAGAFPRRDLLKNYSSFLFQDSVTNFKPTMQGLFWQVGEESQFFNLWLDWNGAQSDVVHESFFIGGSGYKKLGNFFADFQGYMFHYAGTNPLQPGFDVCDNVLGQASVGFETKKLPYNGSLLISGGVLAGLERERNKEEFSPVGFVGRLKFEMYNLGLDNLFYAGQKRMQMYNRLGNNFYWGNPFLQGSTYLESRFYWQIFKNNIVNARIGSNFHVSQGELMYEQVFTLTAKLSSN